MSITAPTWPGQAGLDLILLCQIDSRPRHSVWTKAQFGRNEKGGRLFSVIASPPSTAKAIRSLPGRTERTHHGLNPAVVSLRATVLSPRSACARRRRSFLPALRQTDAVVDTLNRSLPDEPCAEPPSGESLRRRSRPVAARSEPIKPRCPHNSAADGAPSGRASPPA